MNDSFIGTWTLDAERSEFDPNHRPSAATMRWELEGASYLMQAEGECDGKRVAEQLARFVVDGEEHPVHNAPGVVVVSRKPDPNTIETEARMGEKCVGRATYAVSADGKFLTATATGIDAQQRQFTTKVVFQRST